VKGKIYNLVFFLDERALFGTRSTIYLHDLREDAESIESAEHIRKIHCRQNAVFITKESKSHYQCHTSYPGVKDDLRVTVANELFVVMGMELDVGLAAGDVKFDLVERLVDWGGPVPYTDLKQINIMVVCQRAWRKASFISADKQKTYVREKLRAYVKTEWPESSCHASVFYAWIQMRWISRLQKRVFVFVIVTLKAVADFLQVFSQNQVKI